MAGSEEGSSAADFEMIVVAVGHSEIAQDFALAKVGPEHGL